jgi:hypothetical protein
MTTPSSAVVTALPMELRINFMKEYYPISGK